MGRKTNDPDAQIYKDVFEASNNVTAKTFEFNAKEAEKARQFQEYMSNTSHQREVADLIAAGLNPVLSANSGAASYNASSASGSADASAVNALANIYMNRMNNNTSMQIAKINAKVGLASAAATRAAANATAGATLGAAMTNAQAQRDVANQNYITQTEVANTNYAATKYQTKYGKSGNIAGLIDKYLGPYIDGSKGTGTVWDSYSGDTGNIFGAGKK